MREGCGAGSPPCLMRSHCSTRSWPINGPAAAANGTIDPAQRATLAAQMQRAGLGSDKSGFLEEAVAQAMSPAEISPAPLLAIRGWRR